MAKERAFGGASFAIKGDASLLEAAFGSALSTTQESFTQMSTLASAFGSSFDSVMQGSASSLGGFGQALDSIRTQVEALGRSGNALQNTFAIAGMGDAGPQAESAIQMFGQIFSQDIDAMRRNIVPAIQGGIGTEGFPDNTSITNVIRETLRVALTASQIGGVEFEQATRLAMSAFTPGDAAQGASQQQLGQILGISDINLDPDALNQNIARFLEVGGGGSPLFKEAASQRQNDLAQVFDRFWTQITNEIGLIINDFVEDPARAERVQRAADEALGVSAEDRSSGMRGSTGAGGDVRAKRMEDEPIDAKIYEGDVRIWAETFYELDKIKLDTNKIGSSLSSFIRNADGSGDGDPAITPTIGRASWAFGDSVQLGFDLLLQKLDMMLREFQATNRQMAGLPTLRKIDPGGVGVQAEGVN